MTCVIISESLEGKTNGPPVNFGGFFNGKEVIIDMKSKCAICKLEKNDCKPRIVGKGKSYDERLSPKGTLITQMICGKCLQSTT